MKKVTRLVEQFKPVHYIVHLTPDRDKMTFTGFVIVNGQKTGRPSQRLTFHQKDLKFGEVKVMAHTKDGDKEVEIDRVNIQTKFDEVRLHSKSMLYPGKYTITMSFSGKITHNMDGIYPCFFKNDGKDAKLIATQFESHYARQVFPSIDEPEAKATFELSLTTPKDEAVVSNTPIKSQEPAGHKLVLTSFETTPHMSTYLLAFVFGPMKYLESKTKRGVVVRTYATPANIEHTRFALDTAVKCLDYFSEYFDIDYPLAKCDMVALPDFSSGAMENWGCITYREQTLLVDPDNTSLSMKQYVAMVVAHELTHQWFGNLVTMKWWTDLWLNEGFASWFEYLALDHLFPEWQMWTQFIVDDQLRGLSADALEHTHPIEVEVKHPDEIRTIFDSISYHKGASVIHMLYGYIGAETFQTGLRNYLKVNSYKNTVTTDLWEAFEAVSDKPVSDFMQHWTGQSGYPLVTVDADESGIKLRQERFILNPKHQHTKHQTWPVPLLASDLPASFDKTEVELPVTDKFTKLNADSAGFYRAIYNASHLEVIAGRIKTGHLSPLDRLNILADATEAAKAGKLPTTNALHLLEAYENEDNNAVWDIIAGTLGSVRQVMNDEVIREDMKPFVRKLVAKQLARLGWTEIKGEPYFDTLLRPTILAMAALADEPSVVKEALALFKAIPLKGDNKVNPDIRGVVYGTAVRLGGKKEFDKLIALHNATDSNEEKLNICAAVSGFEQPELIKQTLDFIRSEHVRLQDVTYWLVYSLGSRFAQKLTWQWLKDNWKWMEKNLGSDLSFYRLPVYVARGVSDEAFLDDYKDFFSQHMAPTFERSYKQGIEMIQWQSAWHDRDHDEVANFFKQKS